MKQRKLGKKIATWITCFAIILTTINLPAFTTIAKAEAVEIGGIKYVLNPGGEAGVSGDVNYSGDITIPSNVTYGGKNYPVKYIEAGAFSGCTALTSIQIPKSVTSIGTDNFSSGNNIEALVECSTYLKSCVELKNCKKVTMQHHGGTATCKNGKICEGCGEDYTATDPSNHIYTAYLSVDSQMHTKKCVYCEAMSDNPADQENHELSDSETISIDETRHGKVCSKCDEFIETGDHDFIVDGTLDTSKESCTICNTKNIAYTGLDSKVSVAPLTYTGSSQTPIIAITGLTKDTDYTVDVTEEINVGSSYTATITGIGNYAGIRTVTWSISKSAASVKTPNISPSGGKFTSTQTVTITTGTEGAVIHYTTDGSTPTEASLVYTQALSLSVTTTVKAIAIKEGMENSAIASVTFTKQSSGGTGTGGTSDSGTGAGTTTDKPDDKKDTDVTDKTEDKKDTDVADKTESTTDTKTETKEDGTVVKTEADGSKTETLKVESADGKTISTVEVKTDANGNVTDSTVTVETEVTGKKLIVDVVTIKEMIAKNEVIAQANTKVVLTANDDKGNEKYNVEVDAKDIVSKKLVVYALDKNGKVVIVDRTKNKVKVDEAGNISMKIEGTGDYKLLNSKDAKAADKEILKTVEPAKKSEKVKKGEKTEFKLSKKLNKDNIAKITYESNNKNVKVDKKGKITAKMAGKATVTAEVTLQNGKTKKIKMKVKVN